MATRYLTRAATGSGGAPIPDSHRHILWLLLKSGTFPAAPNRGTADAFMER
jgi:hypothetical protein